MIDTSGKSGVSNKSAKKSTVPIPRRYVGSLSYPPCTENVRWTIFRDTVPITLKQISQFDQLYKDSSRKALLFNNYRRLQPLGNRTIYQRSTDYYLADNESFVTDLLAYIPYPVVD